MTGDLSPITMNWRSAMLALVMLCGAMTLLLLWLRGLERRAVGWLIAFVAAGMLSAVPMVIGFAGAYNRWPGLTFLPTHFAPLFGPLLYFHARCLMSDEPLGRLRWLLLPGIAYWFYQLWAFTALGDYRAKWAFNDAFHEPVIVPLVLVTSAVLIVAALIGLLRLRTRYLAWLDDHLADGDRFDPVWLKHLFIASIPLAGLWILDNAIGPVLDLSYYDRFWADFAALFLLFFIAAEALARIQASFPKMPLKAEAAQAKTVDEAEHTPARIETQRDWTGDGRRLQATILEHGWHLEPGISLQELSRRFGMNQTYVSRALNQGLGASFSDVINGLRVNHAQQLIDQGGSSLLDIAIESGFGSKASFNRAFKNHSGMTPSAWQRQGGAQRDAA